MKKLIRIFLEYFFKIISFLTPKKKSLILITADRYNDNSRYLYEYLIKKNDINIYWLTKNIEIKNYLETLAYPCIYGNFKSLYYVMRCRIIITSGTQISFLGISSKTIKYTLWHGTGIKQTEYTNNFEKNLKILSDINNFDYINFTSIYTSSFIAKVVMKIPAKKIVINGYPRFDQIINLPNKKFLKILKNEYIQHFNLSKHIKDDTKLIIYTPTWRNKDKENFFPLLKMEGFKLELFNDFLKNNNYFLFYSTHPNSDGYELKQSNIKYLDYDKLPLFDLTNFILICDILMNDYSTTALEFSLLQKKQISILFDYEAYIENDLLLENNVKSSYPGNIVLNYVELRNELLNKNNVKNENSYISKYYDTSINNSCEINYNFLKGILKNEK